MKKSITLSIFLIFTLQIFAQDSTITYFEIGINGRMQTGNLNQFGVQPTLRHSIFNSKISNDFQANYQYMTVEGFNLINDFWTKDIFKINPNRKFYPMAMAIFGTAKSYLIENSFNVGAGVGYNVVSKSPMQFMHLHLFGGYMYFKYQDEEAFESPTVGTNISSAFPIKNKATVIWELDTYHPIYGLDFWGFNNQLILQFQITKHISFNLIHNTIFNNTTTTNIQKWNTTTMFGIQYRK
jgi:hypothetical protein